MTTAAIGPVPMESNFLVPNATFLVELAAFALLVFLLAKYVIPPINRAMSERQDQIRKEFSDLEQAQSDAKTAEDDFKEQLVGARHEAAKIREEAREQGAAIVADMRGQAQEQSERILAHARAQLEAERAQTVHSLRAEVGTMATTLAGSIVGESLEDDERQSRVVERFLIDLESDGSPDEDPDEDPDDGSDEDSDDGSGSSSSNGASASGGQ